MRGASRYYGGGYRDGPFLAVSLGLALLAPIAALYVPLPQGLFDTEPLALEHRALVAAAGVSIAVAEVDELFLRRRGRATNPSAPAGEDREVERDDDRVGERVSGSDESAREESDGTGRSSGERSSAREPAEVGAARMEKGRDA